MSHGPISERRLRFISYFVAIAALPAFVIAAIEQRWLIVGLYACVAGSFLLVGHTVGRASLLAHKVVAYVLAAGGLLFLAAHLLTR
jgi:hypothetical protein